MQTVARGNGFLSGAPIKRYVTRPQRTVHSQPRAWDHLQRHDTRCAQTPCLRHTDCYKKRERLLMAVKEEKKKLEEEEEKKLK